MSKSGAGKRTTKQAWAALDERPELERRIESANNAVERSAQEVIRLRRENAALIAENEALKSRTWLQRFFG